MGPFSESGVELFDIQGEQGEQRAFVVELSGVVRGQCWQYREESLTGVIPLGGKPLFAVVAHQCQEEVVAHGADGVQGEVPLGHVVRMER